MKNLAGKEKMEHMAYLLNKQWSLSMAAAEQSSTRRSLQGNHGGGGAVPDTSKALHMAGWGRSSLLPFPAAAAALSSRSDRRHPAWPGRRPVWPPAPCRAPPGRSGGEDAGRGREPEGRGGGGGWRREAGGRRLGRRDERGLVRVSTRALVLCRYAHGQKKRDVDELALAADLWPPVCIESHPSSTYFASDKVKKKLPIRRLW